MIAIALVFAIALMVMFAAAVGAALRHLGPVIGLFAAVSAAFIGSVLIVVRLAMDVSAS